MRWMLSIFLTSLLASCGSSPELSPQVRFADDLDGYVVVATPVVQRTEQNLLEVSLPIENTSGRDLDLTVQVEFLDAFGNRYNDETPRTPMLLARGQIKDFRATSMQVKAGDFVATIWMNR